MQQLRRAPRAGSLLKASLALILATSVAWAGVAEVNLPSSGGAFSVHAVITPGSGGGHLDLSGGWEDSIEFSVGVAGNGSVRVNGDVIGYANPNSVLSIRIDCANGSATVTVRDDKTGAVLCSRSGVQVSGTAGKAHAGGATVHSLTAW